MASIGSCNKHPQVTATYRCMQCGKPTCEKPGCTVNNRFCSEACNEKYSTFAKNYKPPAKLNRNPIPGILFFLVVVAALAYVTKYKMNLW